MLLLLVLLFTLLPIIEIALLVKLFGAIGLGPTLLIALGTGVLGASLARHQGLATLARISRQLAAGEPPAEALVDGAMILVAGAVLITPGILTDAFGFSLLLPPVRAALKPLLKAVFRSRMKRHTASGAAVWTFGSSARSPATQAKQGDVLEAEVIEVRTTNAD